MKAGRKEPERGSSAPRHAHAAGQCPTADQAVATALAVVSEARPKGVCLACSPYGRARISLTGLSRFAFPFEVDVCAAHRREPTEKAKREKPSMEMQTRPYREHARQAPFGRAPLTTASAVATA